MGFDAENAGIFRRFSGPIKEKTTGVFDIITG
jgi:hypothetical protein